jgi:hypothetical protein
MTQDQDSPSARVRFARQARPDSDALRCPDCVSEYSVAEIAPGMFEAFVRHDQDCPWLAELERDLS